MTQLTNEEIKKIAHLARINVNEHDVENLQRSLPNILALVEKMSSVDTENVKPLAHAFEATLPLRDDVVTAKNERELFQSIAPQVKAGLYIVPAVIETE